MNTRKVPRTSNRHLAHSGLQHAHHCGLEPKTSNERITESQDKMSCLSHKTGKRDGTCHIRIASGSNGESGHPSQGGVDRTHLTRGFFHAPMTQACVVWVEIVSSPCHPCLHMSVHLHPLAHILHLWHSLPFLDIHQDQPQSMFPISKPCSPTPRNQDYSPLAKNTTSHNRERRQGTGKFRHVRNPCSEAERQGCSQATG